MNATFQVTRNELEAAMLFVSHNETRFVLNGVLVELRHGCFPLLVATDRKAIVVLECQLQGSSYEGQKIDHLIRIGLLEELVASMRKSRQTNATIQILDIPGKPTQRRTVASFTARSGSVFSLVLDEDVANYPSWRQVVPENSKPVSPLKLCFNPQLMLKLDKVVNLLATRKNYLPGLTLWAADPLSIIQATCYGLPFWAGIMPRREDDINCDPLQPAFLKERNQTPLQEPAK